MLRGKQGNITEFKPIVFQLRVASLRNPQSISLKQKRNLLVHVIQKWCGIRLPSFRGPGLWNSLGFSLAVPSSCRLSSQAVRFPWQSSDRQFSVCQVFQRKPVFSPGITGESSAALTLHWRPPLVCTSTPHVGAGRERRWNHAGTTIPAGGVSAVVTRCPLSDTEQCMCICHFI